MFDLFTNNILDFAFGFDYYGNFLINEGEYLFVKRTKHKRFLQS